MSIIMPTADSGVTWYTLSKMLYLFVFIKLEQETHLSRRVGVRNATATLLNC